jgi:hypothetical protein
MKKLKRKKVLKNLMIVSRLNMDLLNEILDTSGNKILIEGTAPNYGQAVVYPKANIASAEIIEKQNMENRRKQKG